MSSTRFVHRTVRRLCAFLFLVSLLATGTLWAESVKVLVDGKPFTIDLPALSASTETLTQAQNLVEALGIQVSWNLEQQALSSEQRISLLEWALAPRTAEEAVRAWARSVSRRNGAWQYAVSSVEERAAQAFAPCWVTGVSSPWADDFEIEPIKGEPNTNTAQFLVRFFWWTSTGLSGQSELSVVAKRNPGLLGEPWLISQIIDTPAATTPANESALPQPSTPSAQPPSAVPVADTSLLPLPRIPFLTTSRTTGTMHQWGYSPVIKSFWHLEKGLLELSADELFEVRGEGQIPSYRLAWNGSDRIAVIPDTSSEVRVFPAAKGQEALPSVVDDIGELDMVASTPEHSETLVARCLWEEDGQRLQLELRSPNGTTIIPLSTENLKLSHTPMRPVALEWDGVEWKGEVIRCFLESTRDNEQGGGYGLLMAHIDYSRIGKENPVSWFVISDILDVSEAGAGTHMTKHGGYLYIGHQEGNVSRINLNTKEQSQCPEITEAVAAFRQRYAPATMGPSSPELYAYDETLIVSWDSQTAYERIENGQLIEDYLPVSCVLAVGADGILGKIHRVGDRVVVYKGDNVTQLIMLSSPETNWGMIFPKPTY